MGCFITFTHRPSVRVAQFVVASRFGLGLRIQAEPGDAIICAHDTACGLSEAEWPLMGLARRGAGDDLTLVSSHDNYRDVAGRREHVGAAVIYPDRVAIRVEVSV